MEQKQMRCNETFPYSKDFLTNRQLLKQLFTLYANKRFFNEVARDTTKLRPDPEVSRAYHHLVVLKDPF